MKTQILYEDSSILVIHKPAGIATQAARTGQMDVVSELKNYLATHSRRNEQTGKIPYLGIIHRLDQPVEGILVFGKTQLASAVLNEELKNKSLHKRYFAAVCGKPDLPEDQVMNYLVRDGSMARVTASSQAGAKKAVMHYRLLDTCNVEIGTRHDTKEAWSAPVQVSLLDVSLLTGRFHQIRVQLSHMGCPLLGDQKYGNEMSGLISNSLLIGNTALCAYHLDFAHPENGRKMEYNVSPENKAFTLFRNFFPETVHTNPKP